MQGSKTKSDVLLIANKKIIAKVESDEIENNQSKKLLRVTIDCQLSFEKQIINI